MSNPGYAGSILYIDLSAQTTKTEPYDFELAKSLIGGYGVNNKLAYELMRPGVDALSPENLIIIGTGPFTGTLVPGASKLLVTTKFPLNDAFATAAGGGSFALMLKTAGYDHAVISGRSQKPAYLRITQDGAYFHDAKELWGKDSYETIDTLRKLYEPCSVIPIGQAGEHLVKISLTSVDKAGTLGRGGLPAVMGSKNLKAIVVEQGAKAIAVAHRLDFQKLVNAFHERILKWPNRQFILDNGLFPAPTDMRELHRKTRRPLACPGCPLAEKVVVRLKEGPCAGLQTYMPHLNINRFDTSDSTTAYEQSLQYIDTLNRYGLCIMNFTQLLSVVLTAYQDGIITKKDTGGIELKDDLETTLKLAQMTAYSEGLGDALAEGLVGAAQKIGLEGIDNIKGQNVIYDPRLRGMGTMEFEQMTTPRGSHSAAAGSPAYEQGRPPSDFLRHGERMGISEEALKRVVSADSFNPGRFSRYSEDWYALFNCLGLCNRAHVNRFYHIKTITEFYTAVTGIEATPTQLMKAAERAWTIEKMLNVREGFGRKDDKPPESWFQPLLKDGKEYRITDYYKTSVLTRKDVEGFFDDYYDERGYDKLTGAPTLAKLEELGLESMAGDLP
ncbi:MAG: aldehyde ferredoxin oxidoreductase N-terminal domain-containing protein [Dehalococcoidales bacterium]|nr:aldehyde ferredoxin oxidoreductase N-terminal domain-containing protein [Dehalococcoidales bacterium]